MDVRVGLWRKLSAKELRPLNCDVGEDSSPLDCREIQPVHPKGNQFWVFIGRTDAEAVTPILWPPDAKSWLIWKDPDAEKDWGQEKGTTEGKMVGWHHQLDGHGFGWTPGIGNGQREAWGVAVHGVIKSLTGLSDWTELKCHPLDVPHFSIHLLKAILVASNFYQLWIKGAYWWLRQ